MPFLCSGPTVRAASLWDTPVLSVRAQQDVHHVAVGAFLCPGRRPRFHHHDRPKDAAARLTECLSGLRFWPLSKPRLLPSHARVRVGTG
jgi:hypothetical protein